MTNLCKILLVGQVIETPSVLFSGSKHSRCYLTVRATEIFNMDLFSTNQQIQKQFGPIFTVELKNQFVEFANITLGKNQWKKDVLIEGVVSVSENVQNDKNSFMIGNVLNVVSEKTGRLMTAVA